MRNFKKFNELEKELEPLRVFSSKLKHLQLSNQQYQQLVNDARIMIEGSKYDASQDQFYLAEIERMIIEIIACVCSIRDCLKGKILANNKGTNGELCGEYVIHQSIHKEILAKTLDQDDQKKRIVKMTNALRNFLLHNSLQMTRFGDIKFISEYEPRSRRRFYLLCDYPHLIEKLEERDSHINEDILCQYYLDKHLIRLENLIRLEPKDHDIVIERLELLESDINIEIIKHELLHVINKAPQLSKIALPRNIFGEVFKERNTNTYVPIYKKILALKAYRLLSYDKALEAHKINYERNMFLNLEDVLFDIYSLHLDYYSQLHRIVKQHHAEQLNQLRALADKFGYANEILKYDSVVPSKKIS